MPRERPQPSIYPDEAPPEPFGARVGALFGAGAVAAALAAIPPALRAGHDSGNPLGLWLALVACGVAPAILGVATLRAARRGLQVFAEPDGSLVAAATLAWCVATFGALAAWGAILRATTHHHALAGTTFALGGIAIGFALALVARRGLILARRASPRARYAWGGLLVGTLGAVLLMSGIRLATARANAPPLAPDASAVFVDVLAFAIAVAFLSRRAFARSTWLARAGIPLAIGLFLLGGAVILQSPWVTQTIRHRAPAYSPAVDLVAKAPVD